MALKIDANNSATAFHINDGAKLFPYALDARSAISTHPLEWSDKPWTPEAASAARQQLHDRAAAEAKARGEPVPAAPPAPLPLSPEDQKALDEHNTAVAEAAKRLADYHKKKAEEQKIADQVAADEALVNSLPPTPDPTRRLSPAQLRKQSAQLTPAEQAEIDRKTAADKKAVDDKLVADKAEHDRLAASGAKTTF
jgi:hypothetical protein